MSIAAKKQVRAKSGTSVRSSHHVEMDMASVDQLREEVRALRDERQKDLERNRRIVRECELLRIELNERNQEVMQGQAASGSPMHDPSYSVPGAVRALVRNELPPFGTLFDKILASLMLKRARASARRRDYASAEVFYQAILLLRPRPFIWRQAGNMLAGQGLYTAAVNCFERAVALAPEDAESYFVMGVALNRIDEESRAADAFGRAIALQPDLDRRPRN